MAVALIALPTLAAGAVSRIIPGTDMTLDGAKVQKNEQQEVRTTDHSDTVARTSRVATTGRTASRTATRTASRTDNTDTQTRTTGRTISARSGTNAGGTRGKLDAAVKTSGLSSRVEAGTINANPAVRRAGLTLRPSVADVGGRAVMASGEKTGSNISTEIRNLQSRAATGHLDTAAIAEAKERLEQTAALNKSCQEQYNDCMDQFCAVIDSNQKRCSCSANLARYTKAEAAVKDANAKLNEVAQNIRYVGLSADEISAIMSATEAEEALADTRDTTESRSMLSEIEKMIQDPTYSSSSYSGSSDSYGMLDIDLDLGSSDVSDLFSLDFLTGNDSSSFSNLRGANLYNAAKKRCSTVISQCKEVGAKSDQITGNYELAIDKDCIAYEQGLNKMNETLVSNVRSATRMLQKARLAVLQDQNSYDARSCISALDKCMTDDMVCGDNYTKCLDPTKTFIDENGSVVLGKNISYIQKFMQNYNNAMITREYLSDAYKMSSVSNDVCKSDGNNDGKCVVKYLLGKIGTKPKVTDEGLCRAVLDKCRAYTYDSHGAYLPYNDIVVNYIQRALVNIKAAQFKIVSDYATECLADVATCYNDQVSQLTSWSATAASNSIYSVMRGACRNVALTCGYAIFANDNVSCPENDENACIDSVSGIFYQSLLCPDNSTYQETPGTISRNNTEQGWVNTRCKCQEGFVTYNGSCLVKCPNGQSYNKGLTCTALTVIIEEEATVSEPGQSSTAD